MQTRAHGARGGDSKAMQRIYARARQAVGDRIEIDAEIERRLAVIVLFAYGDQALSREVPAANEDAIAGTCVGRLFARTTAV